MKTSFFFYLLLPLVLFVFTPVLGQQDPSFTFYRYNMNVFNPAHAGSTESSELTLGVRSQWVGVEGAPESQSAVFGMPVGKNVGLGVSILNDKTFIENQTWIALDFSYRVDLDAEHSLYLGLKGSANSYGVNTEGLTTYGIGQDGSLADFNSSFKVNFGPGAYLSHSDYFFSVSIPKIFQQDRLQEEEDGVFMGSSQVHFYAAAGYNFRFGGDYKLQTMSMYRYVKNAPSTFDLTSILDFGSVFDVGASYRHDEGIAGLFIFKIGTGIDIGYSYMASIGSDLSADLGGTHEVAMRFSLSGSGSRNFTSQRNGGFFY